MKKTLKLKLTTLLVSVALATQALDAAANAEIWREMSEDEKIIMVLGFKSGAEMFRMQALNEIDNAIAATNDGKQLRPAGKLIFDSKIMHSTSMESFSRGMDAIYKDYRNANVALFVAARAVSIALAGGSEEEVEKVLRFGRVLSRTVE